MDKYTKLTYWSESVKYILLTPEKNPHLQFVYIHSLSIHIHTHTSIISFTYNTYTQCVYI